MQIRPLKEPGCSCCAHEPDRAQAAAPLVESVPAIEPVVEAALSSPAGAALATVRLRVPDLCCETESALVRRRLGGIGGVDDVAINLVNRSVAVRCDPDRVTAAGLAQALTEVGLPATVLARAGSADVGRAAPPAWLWLAGALFLLSLASAWWAPLRYAALVATGVGVWPIARRAWGALKTRALDMNALMTTAVVGAVAIGEWVEAAAVVTLFGVSAWLEDRALQRARRAMTEVSQLLPDTATLAEDGREVPLAEVSVGVRVAVKPGQRVPLDGRVEVGRSSIDESALTGESMPVAKAPGDAVMGGTINQGGYLEVRTTALAGDTSVDRMVRLIDAAQASRSPSERFVDRFARVYTPLVMAAALLVAVVPPLLGASWFTWGYRALVLLVVACPCALVIATPVAVVSALARAARRGILVKGGAPLEVLGRVRVLALDKTGTVTNGHFRVAECRPLNGFSPEALHEHVMAAEQASSHPVAQALVAHARRAGGPDREEQLTYETIEGEGIAVQHGERLIHVGNHRMAERLGWCSAEEHGHFEDWRAKGWTVVYTGVDGVLAGLHGLADLPRPEAASAVAGLRALGVRMVMLTGDNAGTAETVRRLVGLDEVRADLLPADKLEAVRGLRREGGLVGMVGDGINDAPALAAADVGIAMGMRGTAMALETADVSLMSDDLTRLPEAIDLGRRTLRTIRQNIAFALLTKLLVLALALAGVATLWMAVAADVGATLAVVLRGLTLLRA